MRILFVNPSYPDTFWSFKHVLKFVSKKAAYAPLGMLTVASMLPDTWEKKLIDTNVRPLKDKDIQWADYVFIGAMLVQQNSVKDIVKRCKSMNKKVVAGGPAFTTSPHLFKDIDHFVLNEAEVTMPMFLKDLEEGSPQHMYTSHEKPDVSTTPIPDWSLINLDDYVTMSIQYSRGCPFNCEFCDIIVMNGRIPRTKSPDQLVAEVESLYNAGWRGSIFIVDDNFIGNKVNVKQMLNKLIVWQRLHDYPFTFLTEASTNLADDEELMKLMSRANFNKVFLGLETPDIESLEECSKFQNKRDLVDTVKTIHNHGMQVMAGFIVGFDSDNESIFDRQINFIQEIGVVTAMVGMLTALPKTRLWERLKKEGRLSQDSTGENTDGHINFIPTMGKEKLSEGYKKIVSTIYSRKEYYQRINNFLAEYKPTARSKLDKHHLKAFIKSVWRIGVISNDRIQYWKLFFRTLFTKARALPLAIELAIFRVHFAKISRRISRA